MGEKPGSRNELHTVIFDQLFSPKTAGHNNGPLSFKQGDWPITDPVHYLLNLRTLCSYANSYLNGTELFALIISNAFNGCLKGKLL